MPSGRRWPCSPFLQRAWVDAEEHSELALTEPELFAHGAGVGPPQRLARRRFLAAQDYAAFLKAGDELLEHFVFRGYSAVSRHFSPWELLQRGDFHLQSTTLASVVDDLFQFLSRRVIDSFLAALRANSRVHRAHENHSTAKIGREGCFAFGLLPPQRWQVC